MKEDQNLVNLQHATSQDTSVSAGLSLHTPRFKIPSIVDWRSYIIVFVSPILSVVEREVGNLVGMQSPDSSVGSVGERAKKAGKLWISWGSSCKNCLVGSHFPFHNVVGNLAPRALLV